VNNGKPPTTPPAPAAHPLPATSKANPDVLGIKVGVSTIDDVRSIFNGAALALRVEEHQTRILGMSTAGRAQATQVEIPNSEYVDVISGTTPISNIYSTSCTRTDTNCQDLQARFSGPPNKGTVLALTRVIQFVNGPLTETVIKGLIDKYGQPGFRDSYGDKGVELRLVWAWAPDGSALTLNARHLCASQSAALMKTNGSIEESKDALQAGCTAILHVVIHQENSVTKDESIYLIDHYGVYTAGTKTSAFVAEGLSAYEKCEREKAAKTSVSREFSDNPTSAKTSPAAADSASSCTSTQDNMNKTVQQLPGTPKAGQPSNTKPAPPSSVSDNASAIADTTTGKAQPDILGVKIGMSAAEVRPILQGRHLQKYMEKKLQLSYLNETFQPTPIPGEFISNMDTFTMANMNGLPPITDIIEVDMTPIVGTERVANITRMVNLTAKKENYLLLSKFKADLIAKYGTPVVDDDVQSASEQMLWRFNARSTSLSSNQLEHECTMTGKHESANLANEAYQKAAFNWNWVLDINGQYAVTPNQPDTHLLERMGRTDCGDYLVVGISTVSVTSSADRLVNAFGMQLSSLSLAAEAGKQVDVVVAKAKLEHEKQILERAKGQNSLN